MKFYLIIVKTLTLDENRDYVIESILIFQIILLGRRTTKLLILSPCNHRNDRNKISRSGWN